MRRIAAVSLGVALVQCLTLCSADVLWEDDFGAAAGAAGHKRYEMLGPGSWSLGEGRCAFKVGQGEARLLVPTQPLDSAVLEAGLTVEKRNGDSWVTAGLTLHLDTRNHWRLILVEGPTGARYFELIEMLDGVHQAQGHAGSTRTQLAQEQAGQLSTWEYGRAYRLRLTLDPDKIEGTVTDPAGGEFWRRTFSFSRGQALRRGRPGLTVRGMIGAFDSLRVEGTLPSPGETLPLASGPAGTVAILHDEGDVVAPRLAAAFREAGYGVTVVAWDELGAGQLPHDTLDLFVLADARCVPLAARDEALALLHAAGKLMAIGAPAFSELRVPTPEGWRGPDDWAEAVARRMARVPMQLAAEAWQRSALKPDRQATTEADPAQGEDCLKVTVDLEGWDTVRTPVPGAFGEDRSLLVFEAKGDADTPQLCIELAEQDSSRWIATVELDTEWRTYVLAPADFPYWRDSAAEARGGPGDRLRPEDAAVLAIGLAGSHTPKVRPGPHTYWFRGLSTAGAAEFNVPDFSVPDVEILCPSYKLYPMNHIASLRSASAAVPDSSLQWSHPAYSPVWRERGRGFDRGRTWRWVPMLDAYDADGRKRGSLVSLMIGDRSMPNAVWANVAVTDPDQATDDSLLPVIVAAAQAMTRGCFLLEGGAELFSYLPGEAIGLGVRAVNTSRSGRDLTLALTVTDSAGATVFTRQADAAVAPGEVAQARWEWRPAELDPRGYQVEARLLQSGQVVDTISHPLEALRSTPAGPDEFVRVEGSNFMLGDSKWFFKGINYRPSWVGGYPHLNLVGRECYDPEILERDLTYLQSIGINAISAVHALIPPDPEVPLAYRDQLDLLNRFERHGMKCFFIVPYGRPYGGADLEKFKNYIARAGIKDHPAIMCWELAWEPIENPWRGGMDFLIDDWNAWVIERYGSIESALADWGFDPGRTDDGKLPIPEVQVFDSPGDWSRCAAAFRRGFSDIISAGYRDMVQGLRSWDPRHLISFRGGGCGVPSGHRFAHLHSVGVARHIDFLNPEGYNLRTAPWGSANPPDDIRRGGLITLYYRFISREKPVVWMEFGYTVNGYHQEWAPELVHIEPAQLVHQRTEYESFYSMIIESGARGAAPWWLPGGFRLGENSDFGIIEPDGTERPACEVLRKYHPQFDRVVHREPTRIIEVDFDAHYHDGWQLYSQQYLEAVQAGEVPYLRSAGTGTDSATCPLVAVGGGDCTGHNPPQFLNAEFNRLEVKAGDDPWRPVASEDTVQVRPGARVLCRASVGNIGEAEWLAPGAGEQTGTVFVAGRSDYGLEFRAPIAADTPFLSDAEIPQFTLIPSAQGRTTVSFEMMSAGRTHFGERRTVQVDAAGP